MAEGKTPRQNAAAALALRHAAFSLPKAGHRADEYEDAFCVSEEAAWPIRAAVADGATESAFAGAWARRLVEGFVAEATGDPGSFRRHVRAWQQRWQADAGARAAGLPWYAAEKAEQGAFATFLGLRLQPDGTWQALAVGDCCLFHLRGSEVRLQWPVETPAAFHHHPALLPSVPHGPLPVPVAQSGTYARGDAFLLASDALAAWLMQAGPARALQWQDASFATEVAAARAQGAMRNDDVTLLVLRIEPAGGERDDETKRRSAEEST